jgi:hypothetical protein
MDVPIILETKAEKTHEVLFIAKFSKYKKLIVLPFGIKDDV